MMEQQQNTSQFKKCLQTAGLLFLLLVLPLGSWFYLSSGLNYQKEALAELKEYGVLSDMDLRDQNQQIITRDSLLGNMLVVSFFYRNGMDVAGRFKALRSLHEQFDDRPDIWFVQHLLKEPGDSSTLHTDIGQEMDFEDKGQCWYLSGPAPEMQELLKRTYGYPQSGMPTDENGKLKMMPYTPANILDYPYFVLVDVEGRIRNYYDYRQPGQLKRMVEHMALIMPR